MSKLLDYDTKPVMPRLWISSADGAIDLVKNYKGEMPGTIVACSLEKEYSFPSKKLLRSHKIKHVHVSDFDDDTLRKSGRWTRAKYFAKLTEARNAIEAGMENKGRVLVHCYAGINRGPSSVMSYLMTRRRNPLTYDQAYSKMKKANKIRETDCLSNLEYRKALKDYASWYKLQKKM